MSNRRNGLLLAGLVMIFHCGLVLSDDGDSAFASTHKQARIIKPMQDGKPVALNTFCLDGEGCLLACVGGATVEYQVNPDGSQQAKTIQTKTQLQKYSAEGEFLHATDLTFRPTAVNVAPDGTIFVAGDGKVAKLSSDGNILTTADSPHVGDIESLRERIAEAAQKQAEANAVRLRDQVKLIEERIADIRKVAESERTELQKRRLETYEKQKTLYEAQVNTQAKVTVSESSVAAAISRKLGITALAVTSRDIFLCCNSVENSGYEVWRTTHEFSEPVRVVTALGGCCGQCDIQATEDHLVLAENTKFKVALLDRDGKRVFDFGKGDRKAVDGFGSCCNPMNVRCCSNGDILTAESSIGTIKRFNAQGELLGVVGKAKIGGGCKHVALAYDQTRNRYYMMNVDRDHVCVLLPLAEAPEQTPDELQAKQAREGLGRKLVGVWTLAGAETPAPPEPAKAIAPTTPPAKSEPSGGQDAAKPASRPLIRITPGTSTVPRVLVRTANDLYSAKSLTFGEDGSHAVDGGLSSTGDLAWEPIRQDGNTLIVSKVQGNIQYYEYRIEFVSDDEANITLMLNERVLSSNRYHRQSNTTPEPNASETAPADVQSAPQ